MRLLKIGKVRTYHKLNGNEWTQYFKGGKESDSEEQSLTNSSQKAHQNERNEVSKPVTSTDIFKMVNSLFHMFRSNVT